MKLLFKQKFLSWLDSFEIFDESGNTVYKVKGQLSWGHCLKVFDAHGFYVGMVKERLFKFLPEFEIYLGETSAGCISKELSFFKPKYNIEFNGWHVEGSFMEWDYTVLGSGGRCVATISKELFNWTDTYVIDVADPADALSALMLVLAIDAEKCSRND